MSTQDDPRRSVRQRPRPPNRSPDLLEFTSQHVVLFTAVALVLGVVVATTGLASFLRVFDWRLIWIVEYPDLLKWTLVALGIMSSFFVVVWGTVEDGRWARNWRVIAFAVLAWSLSLGVALLREYQSTDPPRYELVISLYLSLALLVSVGVAITSVFRSYPDVSLNTATFIAFLAILTAFPVGSAVGYAVRDMKGFQHHVQTRTMGEFRSVGLVMITSRFVVLWDRDHAVVIPADEIVKIEGQPKPGRG